MPGTCQSDPDSVGVGTAACPLILGWDICHRPWLLGGRGLSDQLCLVGVLPTEGLSHSPGAVDIAEGL